MMGPPDTATLEEWRAAFVRENTLRMALRADLAKLIEEMRRDRPGYHVMATEWAARLTAELDKHAEP
jgi:hypothetical protein